MGPACWGRLPLLCARVATPAKLPPSSQPPVTTSALQCRHLCARALEPSHHLLVPCSIVSTLPLSLRQTRYRARSSATKPRASRSASRTDTTESTPSRPLHSAARLRVRSRVGAVCWRPSMHHVDTWIPLSSSPPRCQRTDNTQLACPPRDSHCRCASAPCESTLALPSRRAVTSLSLAWRISRCFHIM
jgi:hypothetical protein